MIKNFEQLIVTIRGFFTVEIIHFNTYVVTGLQVKFMEGGVQYYTMNACREV
jgi:hypothetical protein